MQNTPRRIATRSLSNSTLKLFLGLVVMAVSCAISSPAQLLINYNGTFTPDNLSLNGSAQLTSTVPNRLRLTDGNTFQAGSAFYTTPVNIHAFSTDFTFQLSNPHADGFAFVIQTRGKEALGGAGGDVGALGGYYGGQQALAITFRFYVDYPDYNAINLYHLGDFKSEKIAETDIAHAGILLSSGHLFSFHLEYDGAALIMTIVDQQTGARASQSFGTSSLDGGLAPKPLDLPALLGADSAYVGFSGGTGALTATQDILSWSFDSGLPARLPAPVFKLPSNSVVTTSQPITITTPTPGATIYYTVGSRPYYQNSFSPYTGPFTLPDAYSVVQAYASVPGRESAVATARYPAAMPVDYSSGFVLGPPGYIASRGSAVLNGNRLQLTNGGLFQAGAAWRNGTLLPTTSSFTSDFTFQLTNASADGFMFVLLDGRTAIGYEVGEPGGDLGFFATIVPEPSIGIKWDLFSNHGESASSTGLFIGGQHPFTPSIDLTPSGIDLHSGHVFKVHIAYSATAHTLTVTTTDVATAAKATQTYSTASLPVFGGDAMFGFTGGTGALTATQEILDWTVSYAP